jgi:hypothetical protein
MRQVLTYASSVDILISINNNAGKVKMMARFEKTMINKNGFIDSINGVNAMKGLGDITLYDLMAEDLDVWLVKSKDFGFDLQIDDEVGKTIVDEKGIHPCAIESYAAMCRQFLKFYEKATTGVAA